LTRKRSDKNKSSFFGDHLEIKPSFMQKPKSLDEVMSEAFSSSPPPSDSTVEQMPTVAQPSPVPGATDESHSTQAETASVAPLAIVSVASAATVEEPSPAAQISPARLQAEVAELSGVVEGEWQILPGVVREGANYWHGYSEAWHWLEDRLLPHLEKDLKLTFRRCYRKAFGSPESGGRFFTGQTALAKEVGLSKRRIQDILEIFNLLGWVKKAAHYNRGGLKGTDYEMRLPQEAIKIFLKEIEKP
jgi:hypothetical protein